MPARRSPSSGASSARKATWSARRDGPGPSRPSASRLSPGQVVEKICADVADRGLAAVLDYTRRLDGVTLEPASVRVSASELEDAYRAADPRLPEDAGERPREHPGLPAGHPAPRCPDRARRRASSWACVHSLAAGRRLHSRRSRGLSVDAPDDGRPGAGGGGRRDRRRRAAHPVRRLQRRPAGGLPVLSA